MAHFYAIKQYYKNGTPQTPANYAYDNRNDAEKQFHLLCANAITNSDGADCHAIEWGTLEQGKLERNFYDHAVTPEEPIETLAE